jgi:hypothetical protein
MIYLTDPTLGQLDFTCLEGIVVTSFEIGWPEVRQVINPRALTDGVIDTTTYLGQRAVSVSIRYDQRIQPTQELINMVTPFMSPRYRPSIVWTVQDENNSCPSYQWDPAHQRSLMVRGADAPVVIEGPKYQTMVLQWVAQESYASGVDETCAIATLTGTDEFGRYYDLSFDRDYPLSPVFGITYFDTVGNAPMDWVGTVTAQITDPVLLVNDTLIEFTGVTLLAGQTIIIDTQERTILRNGDPSDSLYGFTNFAEWTWDSLRLTPGTNQIRLQGSAAVGNPAFTLCWTDKYFA